MALFKCKMCGGALEIAEGMSVATCEYCGTKQTLPKLDDEKRATLYDRANHFRRNNEFDKAMGIYEQILNEDITDAEAYWSLVLCRYGIEYVEDPSSRKRIPTVNRAQFTSIFDDDNYKSALQYADGNQKAIYEEEAKAINEIQKGILAISQKEEPFDVFICYKETDNNGRRTPDSVLANDLYHQLTQEGFKVFFSRITLEDKLGSAYEPYIFAALNSAKVMVVLGTRPEHFKAVWVRNEWSRYLSLIKSGAKKMLIPAYKDMDPYDLPDEFAHLQAQDMSKLGFMQDLIRGIKKILQADAPKETVVKETVIAAGNANTTPLLKRAFMFLEDGDWNSANEYCEKVLDIDPECAEAYLGKLMAELKVKKQEALKDVAEPFDNKNNYQKAVRFADKKLKETLGDYIVHINTRNENTRLEGIYNHATNVMTAATTESSYKQAAGEFETILGYKDADTLAKKCLEEAEIARKDYIYRHALSLMNTRVDSEGNYKNAIAEFEKISGWKDAEIQIKTCREKIAEIQAKNEADRIASEQKAEEERLEAERIAVKRKKRNSIIALCAVFLVVVGVFVYFLFAEIIPSNKYNKGLEFLAAGEYDEAYSIFESLGDYNGSAEQCKEVRYQQALSLWEKKEFGESNPIFVELGAYKDSKQRIHTHEYASETTIAPGCETEGEAKFTCVSCPDFYNEPIKATGHTYDSGKVTKEPTCSEKGEKQVRCTVCNNAATEEIATVEHSYTSKITKAATCETNGEKIFTCNCGKSYTETIKATGHNYSNATCTEPQKCKTCGVTSGKAKGHNSTAATCTAPAKCKDCGVKTGNALGHSDNGKLKCSRCNINLTPKFKVTLTEHILPEYTRWKPAGDAYYRMTVKVLDVLEDPFNDHDFEVDFKTNEIVKDDVKKGDIFTLDFYLYNHEVEGDPTIYHIVDRCVIEVTIEPIERI